MKIEIALKTQDEDEEGEDRRQEDLEQDFIPGDEPQGPFFPDFHVIVEKPIAPKEIIVPSSRGYRHWPCFPRGGKERSWKG